MKQKTIKNGIWVVIPLVMLALLFALRGTLVQVGSENMSRMQDEKIATHIADSVRLLYDYQRQGQEELKYTFLEFGAVGCISCRKMETVMEDIRREFAGQVNVRFLNVSHQEAQEWTKFYGVATIPTQIIFDRNGREIFRHTGYISTEDLSKIFR